MLCFLCVGVYEGVQYLGLCIWTWIFNYLKLHQVVKFIQFHYLCFWILHFPKFWGWIRFCEYSFERKREQENKREKLINRLTFHLGDKSVFKIMVTLINSEIKVSVIHYTVQCQNNYFRCCEKISGNDMVPSLCMFVESLFVLKEMSLCISSEIFITL